MSLLFISSKLGTTKALLLSRRTRTDQCHWKNDKDVKMLWAASVNSCKQQSNRSRSERYHSGRIFLLQPHHHLASVTPKSKRAAQTQLPLSGLSLQVSQREISILLLLLLLFAKSFDKGEARKIFSRQAPAVMSSPVAFRLSTESSVESVWE